MPVIGAVPRNKDFAITERHLGLMTPSETPELRARIARLRAAVEDGVDLDRLVSIGKAAPDLLASAFPLRTRPVARSIRIAVARDSAFGFYYADDLEAFERAGAKLCFFDGFPTAGFPMQTASSSAAASRKRKPPRSKPTPNSAPTSRARSARAFPPMPNAGA